MDKNFPGDKQATRDNKKLAGKCNEEIYNMCFLQGGKRKKKMEESIILAKKKKV